jgi:hypothetical protein
MCNLPHWLASSQTVDGICIDFRQPTCQQPYLFWHATPTATHPLTSVLRQSGHLLCMHTCGAPGTAWRSGPAGMCRSCAKPQRRQWRPTRSRSTEGSRLRDQSKVRGDGIYFRSKVVSTTRWRVDRALILSCCCWLLFHLSQSRLLEIARYCTRSACLQ